MAGERYGLTRDFGLLRLRLHGQIAAVQGWLGVAHRPTHDRVDARDELVFVERLGHVVVCAHAEPANLVLDPGKTGENEDGRFYLANPKGAQHIVARHVGKVQVQEDDVVVIYLRELDRLMAKVGDVGIETLEFQHELEALRYRAVILDDEYAHPEHLPNWKTESFGSM